MIGENYPNDSNIALKYLRVFLMESGSCIFIVPEKKAFMGRFQFILRKFGSEDENTHLEVSFLVNHMPHKFKYMFFIPKCRREGELPGCAVES